MGNKTWIQVAGILTLILVSGGIITYTDLFGALFNLKGIEYTYTGDINCSDTCESYINLTTSYWRVCFAGYDDTKYEDETLFKKQSRSRTLHVNTDNIENIISTDIPIQVDWMVPARGKDNWRPIKDGDCWERGKINKIKLVAHKEPWQTVKWTFKTGEYVDIDPLWKGKPQRLQVEEFERIDEKGEYVYITKYYWLYENSEVKLKVPDNPVCLWDASKDLRNCYMDIGVEYKSTDKKSKLEASPKLIMKQSKEKNFKYSLLDKKEFSKADNYTMRYEFEYPPNTEEKFDIELFGITIDPVVSACSTLTSAGLYEMNQSILNSATGGCITIQDGVEDVLFDCKGFIFQGNNGADYGFRVDQSTENDNLNITIQNCNIQDWDSAAIIFAKSGGSYFYNLFSTAHIDDFFSASHSDNLYFNNVTFNSSLINTGSDYGADIYSSTGLVINNSHFYQGGSGFGFNYGGGTFYNSIFEAYLVNPINPAAIDGPFDVINCTGRTLTTDTFRPIFVSTSESDKIYSGWNSNFSSFYVYNSTNITVRDMIYNGSNGVVEGAAGGFFFVDTVTRNYFINNTIRRGENGIYSSDISQVNVINNTILEPDSHGLYYYNTFNDDITSGNYIEVGDFLSSTYNIYIESGNTDEGFIFDNIMQSSPDKTTNENLYMVGGVNDMTIYNNIFNRTSNGGDYVFVEVWSTGVVFNIDTEAGDRIWQGEDGNASTISGNAWIHADGGGDSQTCADSNRDGFCDTTVNCGTTCTDNNPYSALYIDNTPPYWSEASTNTTLNLSETVTFSVFWEKDSIDTSNLSICTFEMFNGTNWTKTEQTDNLETGSESFTGAITPGTPAVVVNDTFTGEVSTVNLADHTPTPTGTTWTLDSSTGGATTQVTSAGIATFTNIYNNYAINIISDDLATNEYNVSIDVTTTAFSDDRLLLFGRYENDENNYHVSMTSASTECHIYKMVSGIRTTLVTASSGLVDGDNITFSITSVAKTVYKNGVSWMTTSDNSVTNIGNAGIGCGDYEGDGNEDCRSSWVLDNFRVEQVGGEDGPDNNADKEQVPYGANGLDTYTDVTAINVTVEVTTYNTSGSSTTGNANPALWLYASTNGGDSYLGIGNFNVTGEGNFTASITNSSILSAWISEEDRNFTVRARYMDYNTSALFDNITWDGVWADVNSRQEFFNLTVVNFTGCSATTKNCWCNVTYPISSINQSTIKWRQYVEDTYTVENVTTLFKFTIGGGVTPPTTPCTESGDCTLDCSENYNIVDDIDIGSNRLTLNGVGDFFINAVIKLGSLAKQIGCRIINAPDDGNSIINEI